ncbi:unnamed protein product [Brassicogethes aeneus]|uniref:Uncharacterized protein n=1 Tax=Brassicogethes aeneus TaxID=1431903 RepID=A0A9P0BIR7_BRAAE|nr:unnamed protein product [Brassicogethes aeneus]
MDPVVRCLNYIRAKALNGRQFRVLFEEEYGELQLYCAVRWLSRGSMLKRFLREQMLQFLEQKGALPLEVDLLKNTSWLSDLAFLVDFTNYLNILNLKSQETADEQETADNQKTADEQETDEQPLWSNKSKCLERDVEGTAAFLKLKEKFDKKCNEKKTDKVQL